MLYIIGTPLGNIQDVSLRAAQTLADADILLVEDTRSFDAFYKRILDNYHVTSVNAYQKIISFHDQNEFKQIPAIIDLLHKNKNVCLVSQAGMPLISDPGSMLVHEVVKADLPLTAVPGPTAFVNAVVLSGFSTRSIIFLGFLPKKSGDVIKLIRTVVQTNELLDKPSFVFYESPHRISETLQHFIDVCPQAELVICREMTKKFEEVARGTASSLIQNSYKGELTVVVQIS